MSASGPECVGEGQIAELVEDDEVAADELVCSAALASGTEFGIEVVDRARNLRAPRFVSGHAAIPALRAATAVGFLFRSPLLPQAAPPPKRRARGQPCASPYSRPVSVLGLVDASAGVL